MERKIGEIFEYNGEWYQCVGGTCRNCICYYDTVCKNITTIGSTNFGNCHCSLRTDHKSVIFKKLEKVGEPYEFARGLYFQRYQLADSTAFYEGDTRLFFNAPTKTFVYIEIKQTKEDMEEKKLNLKPFDIQKAREGKPVCTRDGRKARIICFDRRGDKFPIVALLDGCNEEHSEVAETFTNEGLYEIGEKSSNDIMMLPEKKEGWVNVYKVGARLETGGDVHNTKDTAIKCIDSDKKHIATVKIQWEE